MMQHILIRLVTLYQKYISPFLPPTCRFSPSCSEYALQALTKYGAMKGGMMALYRILRCQPLCKGGYDPVE